ncbi:MAG: pyridoxamine 5'-phosphate oxidase [Bacteroidetes bacterium GWF2_49_14]|nr:MAG: pyridoxamine 5'-phosphate oxidase [Bacteroidetes bacterium GWF2_49_14]HBB91224.1 pyridoxamine 5'-phosphate oxidase [Bacteroidales bacterium]
MGRELHSIRKQYAKGVLDERHVNPDPFIQMEFWVSEAIHSDCEEPTAMVLSTVGDGMRPSSRVVLMKGLDQEGITFFTNYESRKGLQLRKNPQASLLFFWSELERQIRIEGTVMKVAAEESDAYFESRPEASRISAVISPQSKEITSREWLEERRMTDDGRPTEDGFHRSSVIGRPSQWGGYRLKPDYYEFWQGREDRLHDRIAFRLETHGWSIFRLAP